MEIELNHKQLNFVKDILLKDSPLITLFKNAKAGQLIEINREVAMEICDTSGTKEAFLVMEIDDIEDLSEKSKLESHLELCSQVTDIFSGNS